MARGVRARRLATVSLICTRTPPSPQLVASIDAAVGMTRHTLFMAAKLGLYCCFVILPCKVKLGLQKYS